MSRRGDDSGTILILSIGFVAISLALIVVVVDASSVFLARRSLVQTVDGAALAGAQALDDDRLYRFGAVGDIPLGAGDVSQAVTDYMASAYPDGSGPVIESQTDGQTVTVRGRRSVSLPFSRYLRELGWGSVTVTASSQARGERRDG